MENVEWLIPFLYLIDKIGIESLAEELGLSKSSLRKYIYFASKLGLIDRREGGKLTREALGLLEKYRVKRISRRRFHLKGPDGCFLVIIKKRYAKAIRIPCEDSFGNL